MERSHPLPLKPLVFQVLLALADEERHGWSLVREIQLRNGFGRIMPGNFYRTLRAMLADGLIEEPPRSDSRSGDDERRRYFRMTALGREAVIGCHGARASRPFIVVLAADDSIREQIKRSNT